MIILNSFLVCLLAFHQFQLGKSGVVPNGLPPKPSNDVGSIPRIVAGDLANPGEIKYIVITLHNGKYYICGGGIIDNYYVLSAAHCFYDKDFTDKSITVVAGVHDYNDKSDPRRVEVEVEKVYIPNKYSGADYTHDIALLKLKKSLNVEKNDLEILKLPSTTKPSNLTDRMALMAGFGYDQHHIRYNARTRQLDESGTASGLLRKADIKMFDNAKCKELYPKDKIFDSYLCGKMVKESQRREYGVYNGDSGSPLVYDSTVVGVVSWSYGCDERDVPLVYTRVSDFLKFISNVKKNKLDGIRVKSFK